MSDSVISRDEQTVPTLGFPSASSEAASRHLQVKWSSASEVGPVRDANEDAVSTRGDTVFVVADGVGGRPGGQRAASLSSRHLAMRLEYGEELTPELVADVNEEVREVAAREGLDGMASTVAAVSLQGSVAIATWVGDSRIYRLREGMLQRLTRDHNVAEMLRSGQIDAASAGGRRREVLLSYIGIKPEYLDAGLLSLSVQAGDRIILCTDGVSRPLGDERIAKIGLVVPIEQLATELVEAAFKVGGTDNASAIAMEVSAT